MPAVFTESQLLDALARGTPVVLPSARAARALRHAFNTRQRLAGKTLWDAAPALSWADWTRSLWSSLIADGADLRVLLNSAQEHLLWREVIEATPAAQPLTSPDILAEMARSAWSLAAAHHATNRLRSTASTHDSRTLASWADAFARLCGNQACLPAPLLEAALTEHAHAGTLRFGGPVIFAGLLEPTPAQRSLIDALRSIGAEMDEAVLSTPPSEGALRASASTQSVREELILAARWLRSFLESHRSDPQPPRIALLLPNPDEQRAELESVLREVLAPELESIHADPSAAPWEFASGTPLLQHPIAADARDLLHWAQAPLSLERISGLLRSPFVGSAADLLSASRFDAHVLRDSKLLQPELTVPDLLKLARRASSPKHTCPPWLRSLEQFLQKRAPEPSNTYAGWAEFFRALLQAAGFPGDRQPTPVEFATLRSWDSALDLLATLDFRGSRTTLAEATKTFSQLLQSAMVRVPGMNAPIQIMRPADAEGSFFDCVVLLNATDDAWPEPSRANPLLGWPLQQIIALPGTDNARDAERARVRAESLLATCNHVLISSASHDAYGPTRPSPLIRQMGLQQVAPEELVPDLPQPTILHQDLAPDDRQLPPLPSPHIHGGSNVLKVQAACAFRAFAEIRLHSSNPESLELGFDARERGNIVHRALQHFWTSTRSQAELKSLSPEERHTRVHEAVEYGFAKHHSTNEWSDAYIALQKDRLNRVLRGWLDEETKRGPFTVLQQEEKTKLTIGPLELDIRPDRIDQVEGGHVLVDYKTGQSGTSDWEDERPNDPQLPLYALLSQPGELKGMFFAHIRPGKEMGWDGFATDKAVLPGLKSRWITDLDDSIEEWRRILTALAEDFAHGQTDVAPKDYPHTCRYCAQRLLCRLDPATLLDTQLIDDEQETYG